MKTRIPNAEDKYPIVIEMGVIDERTRYLVGKPGFRTNFQKSGLDPVATRVEFGYALFVLVMLLAIGKLHTRNLVYLSLMAFFGFFMGVLPIVWILIEIFVEGNFSILWVLVQGFPYIGLGILFLYNIVLSLLGKDGYYVGGR